MNIVIPKPFDYDAQMQFLETSRAGLDAQIEPILDAVFQKNRVHTILIDGPVCAGKSGVALEIKKKAEERGRLVKVIALTDFLKNRSVYAEECKKKGIEARQEALGALDLPYLKKCLDLIYSEDTALLPGYNMTEGVRCVWTPFTAREEHLIIIEGSYALNSRIKELVDEQSVTKVYVDVSSNFESNRGSFVSNELRLARKFVKDGRKRFSTAEQIYRSWEHANEEQRKYLGGVADGCDFRVDTTMVHEPMMLKHEIVKVLGNVRSNSKIYTAAKKFLSRFSEFPEMDINLLPKDSFYCTFL